MLKSQTNDCKTKSAGRTLEILSSFINISPRQRTIDVAQNLHMDVSTVSRHLNTLLDWGFLDRDDVTGFYYLGLSSLALAGQALPCNSLFRNSSFAVQKLAFTHNVHAYLSQPRDTDIIYLCSCSSQNTIDLTLPVGYHRPMYCSAMGLAMMAYLPENEVGPILEKSKLNPSNADKPVNLRKIRSELAQIQRKGYCLLTNELAPDSISLAVPIFNRTHRPIGAVGVSDHTYMKSSHREKILSHAVLETASVLSSKMGWHSR